MPSRRLHVAAASHEVDEALERLRAEVEVPASTPPEVEAEAHAAADALQRILDAASAGDLAAADAVPSGVPRPRLVDAREIPFVTIDPPTSTDLDQAVHLSRDGEGLVIDYAIASLAEVVRPGGALDADVHSRAVTVYGPGRAFPLHPEVLSSGVCSLLPDQDRIALVWRIRLDAEGVVQDASVTRSLVRSRAQLSYEQVQAAVDGHGTLPDSVPADLPELLREVGEARAARELLRGGASLNIPEQEVVESGAGYRLVLRSTLPVENWNAQVSLTTGITAARKMAHAGVGVLRTLPPAAPRDVERLRATAEAAGIPWSADQTYGEVLAGLDGAIPAHAAFLDEATTLFRGSGYRVLTEPLPPQEPGPAAAQTDLPAAVVAADKGADDATDAGDAGDVDDTHEATANDGEAPAEDLALWRHAAIASRYAHVTAPLRRLVDRYGLETCLALDAGEEPADWVREGLERVVADMTAGVRRANSYERGAVDAIEALLLRDRVGEVLPAVITDVRENSADAQLVDPAARVRIEGDGLVAGTRIDARVVDVDVAERRVVLAPAGDDAGVENGRGDQKMTAS